MAKIGDRVGAILKANETTVHLLGYGIYDGDIENPVLGFPNPRITLDNGSHVWGCECWWGSEDKIRKMIGDREVVVAPLESALNP
ncbi:MAG: hypothetical protein U1E09_00370 [Methylococcales bacterium]|nr:hypothetical protein [Methylobacter sp.]MDZ4154978.1 hypothetical protein [Methylococcales bacterium]MDP2097498.1 hypothetical protein [Methylobacter sp.]MDP2426689.1 hypothetical protein [Methylobacter sp.]MDP3055356.1 hypothetical protein [Methylobacter sp.]